MIIRSGSKSRSRGFSMIEVLIALVILAVGLLGVALLQTLSLRYSQSANYRTKAVNLAYDWLDQARANRAQFDRYASVSAADFSSVPLSGCGAPPSGFLTPDENRTRWICDVKSELGEEAFATVTSPASRTVRVVLNWADNNGVVGTGNGTVTLESQL